MFVFLAILLPVVASGVIVQAMSSSDRAIGVTAARATPVKLPEKLIVGYANWNECDEKIVDAVKQGVNVVMWFSINLAVSPETGRPIITNGPDWDCVADRVAEIAQLNLETVHLISIGGWNSPHPDTSVSAEEAYDHWNFWNKNIAARPDKGFYGFHGFDWDIEGNDDPNSQYNHFTVECLDFMGRFSQLAKQKGGYIVSMAPAESYLDPTHHTFDRSLLHNYPEWEPIVPNFNYHGRNTYAYLLDKYGYYTEETDAAVDYSLLNAVDTSVRAASEKKLRTFDFVTIQLYEGYSHAEYNTTQLGQSSADYVTHWVRKVLAGWEIDYSADTELKYPYVNKLTLDRTELVVGCANGWAGDGKFFLLFPDQAEKAYEALAKLDLAPRGFAFWDILDEGKISLQRPHEPVWMAAGLNRFLKVRENTEPTQEVA